MEQTAPDTPWGIWKQAAKFYREHWSDLVPLLPLFFVPVFVDGFTAFLIAQKQVQGELRPIPAIRSAFLNTPRLFVIKLRFEISGGLWSLIPLLGWYKAERHRLSWAMASNVVAFEDLPITQGIKRCKELIELVSPGTSFRTLVTIPALIEATLMVLSAFGVIILENSFFFWVCTFLFFWTLFPWSAAVNSFFYLSIPKGEVARTLESYKRKLSYQDYCPRCAFFLSEQGICERLHFNVLQYPGQFAKRCNSRLFRAKGAA